jgi:hypothetical protein
MARWQDRHSLRGTTKIAAVLAVGLSLVARVPGSSIDPGLYVQSGHTIYVRHDLPDPSSSDFLDPTTQRTGDAARVCDNWDPQCC